jgi:hypothetical protein
MVSQRVISGFPGVVTGCTNSGCKCSVTMHHVLRGGVCGVQPLMARLSAGWVQQPKKQQQQGGAAAVVLLSAQYHNPWEFQLAASGESAQSPFS